MNKKMVKVKTSKKKENNTIKFLSAINIYNTKRKKYSDY
jgi:hypothetical protein